MIGSGGNFNIQNRAAGDLGGGDPSITPGGGDKRAVLILTVLLVATVVSLLVFL
jgi:hypothetical protein